MSLRSDTVRKFQGTTQHDSPRPHYTKSSQFALSVIQKISGKYEEIHCIRVHVVARCVKLSRGNGTRFTMKMSCPSRPAPIIICRGNFQESFRKRSSRNRSSLQIRDATRVTLGDRFPKGILLTTHDHALLTKNFCALAPE